MSSVDWLKCCHNPQLDGTQIITQKCSAKHCDYVEHRYIVGIMLCVGETFECPASKGCFIKLITAVYHSLTQLASVFNNMSLNCSQFH